MTRTDRNTDAPFNLADALSEDIVAAPAETLIDAAMPDPDGRDALVASFDRIAARAAAQSRRRRIVARLRMLLQAVPAPVAWTSAMAGIAGIFVIGIVGGVVLHQQMGQSGQGVQERELAPARAAAPRNFSSDEPNPRGGPVSYSGDRAVAERPASADDAAHVQPAPAVPAATPLRAPPAAAGVADEPNRVYPAEIRPNAAASQPATRGAPPAPAQDRLAALAIEEEEKRVSTPDPAPSTAAVAPATASNAPAIAALPTRAAPARSPPPAFAWPVRGRVLAGFGASVGGVPNNGIDLAVPAGTDVRAADSGVVLYVGNEAKDLGNLLLLRHRDGFITAYAHAQSFAVKPGDTVHRGQVIAKSGQTGTATKPQLHFEIRKDSVPVDPAQYLPPP